MNKLIFAFIFIFLFINAYTSTDESACTLKKIDEQSRRILSSMELTEDDCKTLATVNDTVYKCSLSLDKKSCLEVEKSACEKKIILDSSRRILASLELTEDDCKTLQTSDSSKFTCAVSTDKQKCVETPSECISKVIVQNSRRLSTDTELTEADCKTLNTTDNNKYKCTLSSDKKSCVQEEIVVAKSECLKMAIIDSSRRILSSTELTEADCEILTTSDDTKYICTLSTDKKKCEEAPIPLSECLSMTLSRRLSSELTEEDCEFLETSDDTIYICALSEDGTHCVEKENSNYLKLATTLILCLFLFI